MRVRWLAIALVLAACDGDGPADAGRAPTDGGRDAAPADAGADGGPGADAGDRPDGGAPDLVLPPANGMLDYQLGEAYPPPSGVVVVSRDREASPAPGVYTICYVNGFQTQPGERSFWESEHPTLLLRDAGGAPVVDPVWNELVLDVTTEAKRAELAQIVGAWIDGCADDGFDAVEIDNLDTYARSGGLITQDQAVDFMRRLAGRAHARGLPIAQKNSAEVLARRAEMGTDFAVVEECNRYDECAAFTAVYDDRVYVIEYRRQDFDAGCAGFPQLSIVLRDLDLVAPGSPGYVYDGC